ncbi:winged helix-turn-helix transcriptional regulator [uncultured Jatrophihabitans sp.]|uniref:winged helix-turn-helix transcriptional regulator n=1 Tax=uncultured Jatrophihabitans sp. TaxID=1610747 RepID=UPI0035C981B4
MTTGPASDVQQHEPQLCDAALSRVFDILGKRWNGMILGALSGGPVSFSRLSRGVGGISDSMLSDRLGELAREGIVERAVAAGPPIAVTYRLTPAGVALMPALDQLTVWARQHLDAPS